LGRAIATATIQHSAAAGASLRFATDPVIRAAGRVHDSFRGIAITPIGGVGRALAVDCDHPAIRGAVIAFVTERSCRRRAWLLVMGDCRTSIADSPSRSRRLL